MNRSFLDGALMLTSSGPAEMREFEDYTVLMTVRGKDHDLTAKDCRAIAKTLLLMADRIDQARKPSPKE